MQNYIYLLLRTRKFCESLSVLTAQEYNVCTVTLARAQTNSSKCWVHLVTYAKHKASGQWKHRLQTG